MRSHLKPVAAATLLMALGALMDAGPASAQWSQVEALPATRMFTVWANGDTIVAGGDSLAFISTDAGTTWKQSTKPGVGVPFIKAARILNGRLYAATQGQGVFISDNLGDTWLAFNQGLVGGFLDSQLDVSDLQDRGDSLYASTFGAGVYVRSLIGASTWHHFGEEFEPNQASNVTGLTLGGGRLLATAGSNGSVFFRDPGDPDWTQSFLNNVGLGPGTMAQSAAWTGTGWVVGTQKGVHHSVEGQEPWTLTNLGLGILQWSTFTTRGHRLFAAFDVVNITNFIIIENSGDDGATWELMDVLPNAFAFQLAMVGNDLYAARADGLWLRSTATVSVADRGPAGGLGFAIAGAQPVRDDLHFRFALPNPGSARIELFDVAGRRTSQRTEPFLSAGPHDVSWSARDLGPGVYEARLTAGGRQEVVRVVHVR